MTVATLAFTLMTACVRPAAEYVHPFEILFFRAVLSVLFMAPWLIRVGPRALRTAQPGRHVLRTALVMFAMGSWFYAIPHIPFVDAVALTFTAPLFTTVLAALLIGEVVRVRRWSAVAVGFAGAMIILRPGFQELNLATAALLLNGLAWAGAVITMRVLTRTESANAVVTYLFLLMVPMALGPALLVWRTPPLEALPWLLLIGGLGTVGHIAATRSVAVAEASFVMPFDYLRLPLFALIGSSPMPRCRTAGHLSARR